MISTPQVKRYPATCRCGVMVATNALGAFAIYGVKVRVLSSVQKNIIYVIRFTNKYDIYSKTIIMRNDILESKEQILEWISQNQSKAFMCSQFKCRPSTLESYLKKMGIEYVGNMGGRGIKTDPKRKSALEYSKSTCVKTHLMKLKLIEDGIREHKCEICGITEWLGEPAPLELHHIDGNRFSNNFDNLQILCPNCHSQTPNHSGRKTKLHL